MTWLHSLIRNAAPGLDNYVVCEITQNLAQFPLEGIRSLEHEGRLRRLFDKGVRKLGLRRHLSFAARTASELRPDILHSHFGDRGWQDLPIARALGLKHVVTFYGYDVNMLPTDPTWRARYKELFDSADRFLCEGPHMARCLVELGCPEAKVHVQRLGVSVRSIRFVPRTIDENGPLRILIAGTFREKKGIPDALEAIGRLRRYHPNVLVTIIGDSTGKSREEAEKRRIAEVIAQYDLGHVVTLLGFQPHARLFEEAYKHHVFLSPSVTASDGDTEGGAPVTLIEMAATGMPIVSTTHCDIPEVVLHGESGLLCPERNPTALAEALLMIANDPQYLPNMGLRGRQHIEAHFDLEALSVSLADRYAGLTNS